MNTPDTVICILEQSPSIIIPMVRQADPSILKRRPPSGKWSIHEHACHLAEVHPIIFQRLERMRTKKHPRIQPYDPGKDGTETSLIQIDLESALERFEQDRVRLIEQVRTLKPEEWNRTGDHEEYNYYSIFTMLRHLVLHDFFHTYRIEELLLCKDWPAPSAVLFG